MGMSNLLGTQIRVCAFNLWPQSFLTCLDLEEGDVEK